MLGRDSDLRLGPAARRRGTLYSRVAQNLRKPSKSDHGCRRMDGPRLCLGHRFGAARCLSVTHPDAASCALAAGVPFAPRRKNDSAFIRARLGATLEPTHVSTVEASQHSPSPRRQQACWSGTRSRRARRPLRPHRRQTVRDRVRKHALRFSK